MPGSDVTTENERNVLASVYAFVLRCHVGAGYTEAEVWTVMTNPANGISDKFFEKGRRGEAYLGLTIGKARTRTAVSSRRRGKAYARRTGVISVD